jgi:hypothetical protein
LGKHLCYSSTAVRALPSQNHTQTAYHSITRVKTQKAFQQHSTNNLSAIRSAATTYSEGSTCLYYDVGATEREDM